MKASNSLFPRLIADLGGTNIRLAISQRLLTHDGHRHELDHLKQFALKDYPSLENLLKQYLSDINTNIQSCCFAVAGPVNNGHVSMTNYHWQVSESELRQLLGVRQVALINDFAAIAHAVPVLSATQFVAIGAGCHAADAPIAILGPGTGLGAAQLIPIGRKTDRAYQVVATQAGHVALNASTEKELAIFDYWRSKGHRINREFFISGAGIEKLYQAIVSLHTDSEIPVENIPDAAVIQQRGCHKDHPEHDQYNRETMEIFCALVGSAAGDQVLATGARGGLVLAGGILPRFVDFLASSDFRARFESKGEMSDYNKNITTHLIIEPQPGLMGAAAFNIDERQALLDQP